eukprot:1559768-Pyramimonas_sp.AAC.1
MAQQPPTRPSAPRRKTKALATSKATSEATPSRGHPQSDHVGQQRTAGRGPGGEAHQALQARARPSSSLPREADSQSYVGLRHRASPQRAPTPTASWR